MHTLVSGTLSMAIRTDEAERTIRDWIGCCRHGAARAAGAGGGGDQMLAAIAAGADAIYAGLGRLQRPCERPWLYG